MPYEPSFMSTNTLSASLKKLGYYGKPDVNISLDHHNSPAPHTYTTADSISGTVSITSPSNARFDEVHIALEGSSHTIIELMSPVAHQNRQEATHRFLNLRMPVPDAAYPVPRIAEQGVTYTFPFTFVVPSHMLPSSCTHACTRSEEGLGLDQHVREAHLRLPPTIGERVSKDDRDDLAPSMARIGYAIRVRVTSTREHDGRVVDLVSKARPIRIVPSNPESPPLHIGDTDPEYVLRTTKTLKKGVFKGRLGTISLSAAQPKAITTNISTTESAPTTIATLKLRFDPASDDIKPPRLGALTSKINVSTFFAIRAARDLLLRPSTLSEYDIYHRVYSESVSLASRCVEAVDWTMHSSSPSYTPYARRDSGYSTSSSTSSSSSTIVPSIAESSTTITNASSRKSRPPPPATTSKIWHEATILVPLTLPTCKSWLPTFHSCIISRIYALDFSLTAHTPGTAVPATSLSLHLPIELVSTSPSSTPAMAEFGDLTLEQEVDADLAPRSLDDSTSAFERRRSSVAYPARTGSVVAAMEMRGGVGDELPGYEAFARGSIATRG